MNFTRNQGSSKGQVAIIGGGPAGAITALALTRAGVSVVVIEREVRSEWKIGEGLPPAVKPILHKLELWERFLADGHLASYGNCSGWGSDKLVDHSFVFHPHGCGWHLDRNRFDQMLLNSAVEAGATLVLSAESENTMAADVVVDASGRNSWLARRQGARRINHDNLVGSAALLKVGNGVADQDSLTMVEAVADGWWYAALLPDQKLVVVFLSDADLEATRMARTAEGWLALLKQTKHLRNRVERHAYRIELEPRLVSANSSRLDVMAGESWLAVGDAAAAFDPLSSQGIITAMESGMLAAQAIQAKLVGQPEALNTYAQRMEKIFAAYLANRDFYYAQERRWPESKFWQRRHGAMI
ncbi:MAG: NAD(P)/FAD-dependent oxidoreductase [Acidobacteria bacterium]|nr:NAD(P)/FAD-dependent oxidoreductase [Acidobacteriota bacterium]